MPKFRALHNPNFNLHSHALGRTIFFSDSTYETEDPAEVRELRSCVSVEEVSGTSSSRTSARPSSSQQGTESRSSSRTADPASRSTRAPGKPEVGRGKPTGHLGQKDEEGSS